MTEDTRLLDFYEGKGTDHRGRTLSEIQHFSAERLEDEHDFIQWLFPLRTPSPVNPRAPVLTDGDVERFRASPQLGASLRRSFEVMLDFYGFEMAGEAGMMQIRRSSRFPERAGVWLHPGSHNFLRITRILASMTTLGHEILARAFVECLKTIFADRHEAIGEDTWAFWIGALRAPR